MLISDSFIRQLSERHHLEVEDDGGTGWREYDHEKNKKSFTPVKAKRIQSFFRYKEMNNAYQLR